MTGDPRARGREERRRRLRAVEAAMSAGWPEERVQATLAFRAARLAAEGVQAAAADAASLLVLAFRTGGERCALEVGELAEIAPLSRWTPLPDAPPEHVGVVNRRGEIQPVADLARLLGLPAAAGAEGGYVLTLNTPGQPVGVRVDAIEDMLRLGRQELQPPPLRGSLARYARGMAPDGRVLLSVPELLSHPVFKERSR
jgi:purine-binding chemotaxis protein CheW